MAKSLNYFYDDEDCLQAFIEEQELQEQHSLLVKIFAGSRNAVVIQSVTEIVKKLLPQCFVIGCTTKAELASGYIYTNEIVLSFTSFKQTKVESIILNKNQFSSSREMGQYAIKQLAGPNSKLLFLFTSVLDEELTESLMMNKVNYSISIMQELKSIGVKVSIDDFGTGYSALSYLKHLPIDCLKIDRSFINNLKQETADMAIVEAIITMGHGLSVKVVAEGVEKQGQMTLLKEMKCHYAQGYFIDWPLKSEDFERGMTKKLTVASS